MTAAAAPRALDLPGVPWRDRLEVSFPARPDMAVLARLAVAAVAARADFGLDQVDDLRLATDELCIALVGDGGHARRVALSVRSTADAIAVSATLDVPGPAPDRDPDLAPVAPLWGDSSAGQISERILDALTDEHGVDSDGPATRVWCTVRRRGVPGSRRGARR